MRANSRAQVPAIRQAWLACCSRTKSLLPLQAGKPMKLPLWLHNSWRRPASSLPWLWSNRHSSSLCRRCVKVEQVSVEMQQVSVEMQQLSEMRVTMLKYVEVQGALCVRALGECSQQHQWSAIGLTTTWQKFEGERCASHSMAHQSACS